MVDFNGLLTEAWINDIYRAGAIPGLWSETLDRLSQHCGARGVNLIRSSAAGLQMISTPRIAKMAEDWAAGGWNSQNTRVSRLLDRSPYPGFLADSHMHTADELIHLPIYAEFLNPRGVPAGCGTVIQGAADESLAIAFEGFADHPASREAAARLDMLRPHLARAMVLSTEVETIGARSVLDAFEVMGMPVALLSRTAGVIGANPAFQSLAEGLLRLTPTRFTPLNVTSLKGFEAAFARVIKNQRGDSLVLRGAALTAPAVLHLLPRASPENPFRSVAVYAVLARPGNMALPRADIIAALFDLTPAEARVARAIALGQAPSEIATAMGVSPDTVRTQLKRVFQKTSVSRQSELAALMGSLSTIGP